MRQKSNYRILNLIGQGQFGRVFVAIETQSGHVFAIKQLNQKCLSTSDFLRELNFLVSLDHPNIVAGHALEHYRNHRYLVLEYCEGGTLRELLESPLELSCTQILQLGIDILNGLQYAHDRGVVHRDIKPENILLQLTKGGWTAKIADFGIAQLFQGDANENNLGDTGSPAYMSPEQFYGQYTYSCDLYAVGIILYELLVGERPFSGMPKELVAAHLSQPIKIPLNIPLMVRLAIAKSLQKLPHRRFASAVAMAEALKLARDVLPQDFCLVAATTQNTPQELTLLSTTTLSDSVDCLAVVSEQIYLSSGDNLSIQRYTDATLSGNVLQEWQITLDRQIQELSIQATGCLLVTQASIYYVPFDVTSEQFDFLIKTFLPIISFPTDNLVTCVAPQGHWFAVSYIPQKSKTPSWEIWQLPNCQRQRSQINRRPWNYLVATDRRYGLGIYDNPVQQCTEFHLFNRRGNWLVNHNVQVRLEQVSHNPLFPQQLLAIEADNPNTIIAIELQKFQLQRLPLNTLPRLIVTCPQGYLISDRQNSLTLVNGQDWSCQELFLPLPPESIVTAIAATSERLLVAAIRANQSQLYQFQI